jgi:hypothetical protein
MIGTTSRPAALCYVRVPLYRLPSATVTHSVERILPGYPLRLSNFSSRRPGRPTGLGPALPGRPAPGPRPLAFERLNSFEILLLDSDGKCRRSWSRHVLEYQQVYWWQRLVECVIVVLDSEYRQRDTAVLAPLRIVVEDFQTDSLPALILLQARVFPVFFCCCTRTLTAHPSAALLRVLRLHAESESALASVTVLPAAAGCRPGGH